MKKLIFLLFLMIYAVSFSQDPKDTLVFNLKNSRLIRLANLVKDTNPETYQLRLESDFAPAFLVREESQLGLTVRPVVGVSSSIGAVLTSFKNYRKHAKEGYILQFGQHDFNSDGFDEIVVAYGLRGESLKCQIFKYHEPANEVDVLREENWNLVGEFETLYHDPRYISIVEDSKIFFPIGSQGYSVGYVFVEGKFVKFQ